MGTASKWPEEMQSDFGDERVQLVCHDLDESLPSGTFDVVVSSFAIHHCVDERKATIYAEVFERLEPGGIFVNLEHVASPTAQLHEAFLVALGRKSLPCCQDAARSSS